MANYQYAKVLGIEPTDIVDPKDWHPQNSLPPEFESAYYQNHWLRMRGDGLLAVDLSVLNVFVESTAGLSVSAISEIIDEDEYEIEKALDNWIEFLNKQEIGREICYSLYHDSFRDWLGKQSILE